MFETRVKFTKVSDCKSRDQRDGFHTTRGAEDATRLDDDDDDGGWMSSEC